MRKVTLAVAIALVAVLALGLAACGGTSEDGLASVHNKIEESTDCSVLQETFDRNMGRYEMMDPLVRHQDGSPGEAMFAYANAADDRMRDIGCY